MKPMRWFGKKAPCPLADARWRHRRLIDKAMTCTQGADGELIKPLIEHLLTWVWDLPGDWQMFRGTLDLYTRGVERGYEGQGRTRRLERGEHTVLLMAAAFWCCQTLTQYRVEAEDCQTSAVHVWTYDVQRFFDWLKKWGDHERLPAYEATAVLTDLSPAQKAWVATWLIPSRFVLRVGNAQGGRFWAFVLADKPTTDLHRQLGLLPTPTPPSADVPSYDEVRPSNDGQLHHHAQLNDEVRPHDEAPPGDDVQPSVDVRPHDEREPNHKMQLSGLVRGFLKTMAAALRDGIVRVNTRPAHAFADAQCTFLVYPKGVALCFGDAYRPQVVLDHLIAAGLTGGTQRVRFASKGGARPVVFEGFWLRNTDLGYVPDAIFEGTIEVVS